MSADGSVTRWIADLEIGQTDQAQEELWRRYFCRLMGLAKLKLGATPRGAADEEDVAAATLNSFFAGVARRQFPSLRDRNDLWPLLAKITAHKVIDQQRYLLAEKRGGGRVRGDSALAGSSESLADWPASLSDDDLRPEFLVALSEQFDHLLGLLPDDELRQIALRRLEGFSNAEIAKELSIIERTVERRLQLIRKLWAERLRDDASA